MDFKIDLSKIANQFTEAQEQANAPSELKPLSGGIADMQDMLEVSQQGFMPELSEHGPLPQGGGFDFKALAVSEFSRAAAEFSSAATQGSNEVSSPYPTTWGDLEDRIHSLEARLAQMNTPEASRVLNELRDFERQIQDMRSSNPFAFVPNSDFTNRMQMLQSEATNALKWPTPPQTQTPAVGGTDAQTPPLEGTDANTQPPVDASANVSPYAPPYLTTWSDMEDRIHSLEARLAQMNTPEANRVLYELRDFERQIQDMRSSNPFAFMPNSDFTNRMQMLDIEATNALKLPAPTQPTYTTPVQQTDTPPATDPTATTDPAATTDSTAATDPTQTTDVPPDPTQTTDAPADVVDPNLDPNVA